VEFLINELARTLSNVHYNSRPTEWIHMRCSGITGNFEYANKYRIASELHCTYAYVFLLKPPGCCCTGDAYWKLTLWSLLINHVNEFDALKLVYGNLRPTNFSGVKPLEPHPKG